MFTGFTVASEWALEMGRPQSVVNIRCHVLKQKVTLKWVDLMLRVLTTNERKTIKGCRGVFAGMDGLFPGW